MPGKTSVVVRGLGNRTLLNTLGRHRLTVQGQGTHCAEASLIGPDCEPRAASDPLGRDRGRAGTSIYMWENPRSRLDV